MLYDTKSISEKYNVSSYKITQDWCKNGLKHTPDFKYKLEWVEEFLEEIAIKQVKDKFNRIITVKKKLPKRNTKKITLEDLE